MIVGYPDYFGMPVFPSYGPFVQVDDQSSIMIGGGPVTVIDLDFKCSLQQFNYLFIASANAYTDPRMQITLDGVTDGWFTPINSNYGAYHMRRTSVFEINIFDPISGYYGGTLIQPLDVGQSIKIEIKSFGGTTYSCKNNYIYRRIL